MLRIFHSIYMFFFVICVTIGEVDIVVI
jgi:hypothetical protein